MSLFSKRLAAAVVVVLLSACDQKSAQPDAAAVAASSGAYKTCAACHGATGLGNAAMQAPALVSIEDWYLERQLNNFRNGVRGQHPEDQWGQVMADQATLLADDAAVKAVVAQIATFRDKAPEPTFDADLARGRDHYNMTCGACHGPEGVGNAALNAPSLRGMDDWYVVRQYENFRTGIRGAHSDDIYGQQMARMGQVLRSEDDVRDVAAWLLSLGIDD